MPETESTNVNTTPLAIKRERMKTDSIVLRSAKADVPPARLDLKTRITLMASIIYGASDQTVEEAVETAVEIENVAEQRIRRLKTENPISLKRAE